MVAPKKRALVTGGAGFVGSHLCERLVREGYTVISLDNYFTGSPQNHVSGVVYRTGHTKDIAKLVPETPDIIYHLGEYARTEKSFEDIEIVLDFNGVGTMAVLEFWRRTRCKLVYSGSSTKFADGGDGARQSPYAWTKSMNTESVKRYGEWFNVPYAITYFYNVYGPREMSGAYGTLISIFDALYRKGQPLTVVKPGTQVRNFTHVADIIEGLVCVGERGEGDSFGIGSDDAYTVIDVARMFGGEILLMPERKGNRQTSVVETSRTKELGWKPTHTLPAYIDSIKKSYIPKPHSEKRILVFSTTFYPNEGKAEQALTELMRAMPHISFDVITTFFSKEGLSFKSSVAPNVQVYRVGYGHTFDKFLLPFFGARVALQLQKTHTYYFVWSLFASYGALGALFSRRGTSLPTLITVADQKLARIPWYVRWVMKYILKRTDQVYADDTEEVRIARTLAERASLIRSVGEGDVFANQIRFAYSTYLKEKVTTYET